LDDQDGWKDKELSRREFLKLLGVGSLGVGLALFGIPKALKTIREASKIPEAEASRQVSDKVNNKNMLGIFYYPWYGGKDNKEVPYRHWKDDGHNPPLNWNSRYLPNISGINVTNPAIRLYDSQDQATVNHQMNLIKNAHIHFVIWSWWGKNTFSDHALDIFWRTNSNTYLKHCIYYEKEWLDDIPASVISSDIDYIKRKYAGFNTNPDPRYLRIDNKAVVFVNNTTPIKKSGITDYQRKLAAKWNTIRKRKSIYTVLKVSNGWQNWKDKSNSWHQYEPSTPYGKVSGYSSYVSPGWWSPTQKTPSLKRDITRFTHNIKTMKSDGVPLHTIQTWNEWTEGTGIEPATFTSTGKDHGNTYINIIAKYF